MKYFFAETGEYLGGFDEGSLNRVPEGAIEWPSPPAHGLDRLVNGEIVPYVSPTLLADNLKSFLLGSLETYQADIDPYTEMKIRQLQKTLEPLPADMDPARFAAAVRTEIENFPLPEVEILQNLRAAMLAMLPAEE